MTRLLGRLSVPRAVVVAAGSGMVLAACWWGAGILLGFLAWAGGVR